MSEILTRDTVLAMDDITTTIVTFPKDFSSKAWAGKSIGIRQLNREEQDAYLRRQFGAVKLKQNTRKKSGEQEISQADIYGHDAWLVVKGTCDEQRNPIFTEADIPMLVKKNGEAIGWLAVQILEWSGMREDINATPEETTEEAVKNS